MCFDTSPFINADRWGFSGDFEESDQPLDKVCSFVTCICVSPVSPAGRRPKVVWAASWLSPNANVLGRVSLPRR
jgi:hypothetical protein